MQHVFIVGSKGIPGAYGGYETFVDKLTEYHQDHPQLRYHVACKDTVNKEEVYHNARCFHIKVPNIGPAQAIYYDVAALAACCKYIQKNSIPNPIVYILACRIGPFMNHFVKKIHKLGGVVYVNPDGHEWLRAKWPAPVRKYWKISEQLMTKHADLMVCDSKNIEAYIRNTYAKYAPKTTFIAYGAETRHSHLADDDPGLMEWYGKHGLQAKGYYLVVGRFVPENNFETMIREFMKSKTDKVFALITNVSKSFLNELEEKTGFREDPRIRFVGTVYDQELLMKIRENAYGYFHGHEVGGTNPSLLEALSSTDLNLLLGVGFNREVAEDAALYWSKEDGALAKLIESADALSAQQIAELGQKAKARIADAYSWQFITEEYEKLFLQQQERSFSMNNTPMTMAEIQQVSLQIVKKIHELCRQLGLRYYLAYGTLIGAIRHQGFIPWDDDLDIMMPREDYETLQAYFRDHKDALAPLELICPENNPDYPYTIGRVSNSDYLIDTDNEKPCGLGIFVDIYPLDNVGSDPKTYARQKNTASRYASLCFLSTRLRCEKGNTRSPLKRLVKYPAFLAAKLLGKRFFFRKLRKLATQYRHQDSPYTGVVEWGSDGVKDIYPKEWFGNGIALPYEDTQLTVPVNYDAVLRQMYGDYMQLPPENQRIAHHFYRAYRK